MNGLEIFACGIMWREGEPGYRPPARSFRNCNPLNLRTPSYPTHDPDGFDVYPDFISGFNAGLRDLQGKFNGHNSHGLGQESTVLQFFQVFAPSADGNSPLEYSAFMSEWLTAALGKEITPVSLLKEIWSPPIVSSSV